MYCLWTLNAEREHSTVIIVHTGIRECETIPFRVCKDKYISYVRYCGPPIDNTTHEYNVISSSSFNTYDHKHEESSVKCNVCSVFVFSSSSNSHLVSLRENGCGWISFAHGIVTGARSLAHIYARQLATTHTNSRRHRIAARASGEFCSHVFTDNGTYTHTHRICLLTEWTWWCSHLFTIEWTSNCIDFILQR